MLPLIPHQKRKDEELKLSVVAGVARRMKRVWDDVSPYSIASVHVAFINGWKEIPLALLTIILLNTRKSSAFLTVSFLFNEAFAPLSNSLHLLPHPGKPPRLESLSEHRYPLPLNSWLYTDIIVWLTLSLWSYRLSWDYSVFILFWLWWLLFLLASLFFLNACCFLCLNMCLYLLGFLY